VASRVAVIDYGMGNIGSICKMLRLVGAEPIVSSDPQQLRAAEKLILPGVGHFDRAMANLDAAGLVDELKELVQTRGMPILGICLGMQLMCRSSEEGTRPGLGFVDARVRRFDFPGDRRLKVPHMGWRDLELARPSRFFDGLADMSRFYFVHSYFVECSEEPDVLARATHGHPFVAAFERGNVKGVQFHPEKSHRFGIRLFQNFVSETK
jgi:imidazole glycerol-phosphate synthase subunit HisH